MADKFKADTEELSEILKQLETGEIQLPDFQRSWVWNDEDIKSLLVSVFRDFPIGAIMLSETGNPNVKFLNRPISGAINSNTEPKHLILDGQQRLTTLYNCIKSKDIVNTKDIKGKNISRWYYIDIRKSLNSNIEESIFSVNSDKVIRNRNKEIILDLSSEEKEFNNLMFPINKVNETDFNSWRHALSEHINYLGDTLRLIDKFKVDVLNNALNYRTPIIELKKNNSRESVCIIFEKVNTSGVKLNVFELVTAMFAADEYRLREVWNEIKEELNSSHHNKLLEKVTSTDFLQAVTLYSQMKKRISGELTKKISGKRDDILDLKLDEFKNNYKDVIIGFKRVAKFLFSEKFYQIKNIPYPTQLVPLAVVLGLLDEQLTNSERSKIKEWYWNGVFGELYGSAVDSRISKDVPQLYDFIKGIGSIPDTIRDSVFYEDRLYTLKTRNSAAYKGVYTLLLQNNVEDFISGNEISNENYFDDAVDIHHIFPNNWIRRHINEPELLNLSDSIINKTPISSRTNRIIGSNSPSDYTKSLIDRFDSDENKIKEIYGNHLIDYYSMTNNDFENFLKDRKEKLKNLITNKTGREIVREEIDI